PEDGIRDRTVTGVQTCALPIYGAFKMSEWVHQDHITLVPNPNYAGTKPSLQKVTLLMVTSNEADYAAYRNNERDWTLVPDADVQIGRASCREREGSWGGGGYSG